MQWLRILLPRQGTWVRALVLEDPTCHRATKPVRHEYWASTLEPVSHKYWAHVPQLLKPMRLEPVLCNKRSPCTTMKSMPCLLQLEKACAQQRRPNTEKNKLINKFILKKTKHWTNLKGRLMTYFGKIQTSKIIMTMFDYKTMNKNPLKW